MAIEKSVKSRAASGDTKSRSETPRGKTSTKNKPRKYPGEKLQPLLKELARKLQESPGAALPEVLKQQNLSSPLIIVSTESLRTRRAVAWLKELFPNSETTSYFGSDLNSAASTDGIRQALVAMSLFSRLQIVVIYEADAVKAAAQKALTDAIKRGTHNCLLVLTTEKLPSKAGLLSEACDMGTVFELGAISGQALLKWIEREVATVGLASGIKPDACQLLAQYCGDDLSLLASEIAKLSLLTPHGEPISRSLVASMCAQTGESSSFELVRSMAAKSAVSAALIEKKLCDQGLHPLQISAFLSRAFRTILAQRQPQAIPAGSELGNPWFAKQLGETQRKFSDDELIQSIRLLTELDFRLKDSRMAPELVLSNTVQRIALRQFSAGRFD